MESEWPIYLLADYDGSGALVEAVASRTASGASKLNWWQIVAATDKGEPAGELDLHKPLVAELCATVYSTLSPYLVKPTPQVEPLVIAGDALSIQQEQVTTRRHQFPSYLSRLPNGSGAGWQRHRYKQQQEEVDGRESSAESWRTDSISDGLDASRVWSGAAEQRGRYGESLIHILLIDHCRGCLILLVVLIHLWPALLLDTFQSCKFLQLGCLHLAIGHQASSHLLAHLINCARRHGFLDQLLEQRVRGSLFNLPGGAAGGAAGPNNRIQQAPVFWCDRTAQWPTTRSALNDEPATGRLLFGETINSGLNYLGDSPLAWAVSLRHRDALELLVSAGAQLRATDRYGNSCLHLLVINNRQGWARLLVRSGASMGQRNGRGLSPLLMASHMGRHELFEEFLELDACEFWSYSMVRCSGYPLGELDSLVGSCDADWRHTKSQPPAVSAILESSESSDEQKARLLSSDVVKKLLEEKWYLYARNLFYRELSLQLVHLALLSVAINLRETKHAAQTATSWYQGCFQCLAELGSLSLSCLQLNRFRREWLRYRSLALQWAYNPLLPNFVAANLLILMCAPLRAASLTSWSWWPAGYRNQAKAVEDVLLIFAAPLLWSSLLFFIAAFKVTGPFVAMISYMLVRDLRQFSLIYLIFIYSFAQCIFFVNQGPSLALGAPEDGAPQVANNSSSSSSSSSSSYTPLGQLASGYTSLWMDLFKMTLGVYDLQPYRHSVLARFFFLLFIYLIPILFNMLIAMMNNTYSSVISQSERAWSFQWARTLFALERRLSWSERDAYLRLYSINMAPSSSTSTDSADTDSTTADHLQGEPARRKGFVPGLMIIKRMGYTRAERSRLVLAHWQRAIKTVLQRPAAPGGRLAKSERLHLDR